MDKWQLHVVAERDEVDTKLKELKQFLGSTECSGLKRMERFLLSRQLEVMREYSRILGELIKGFAVPS